MMALLVLGVSLAAALGGALVSLFGFGALSGLLVGTVVASGLPMAFVVNDKAVERARDYFSKPPDNNSR